LEIDDISEKLSILVTCVKFVRNCAKIFMFLGRQLSMGRGPQISDQIL